MAAEKGKNGVVELLLGNEADVYARSHKGATPLHLAAQNGHKNVVKLLLNHGADVNAKTSEGYTPLALALEYSSSKVVDLLLADSNINIGHVKVTAFKSKESKVKFLDKLQQDNALFNKVKEVAEGKNGDKLLKEIKDLLKPDSKYGFKPSLNYSPNGNDENTTIKIAIEAGGEVLQLLYNYAKENIGIGTKIFEQLERAKEQQENSQPKSDFCDVSVSGNLTQDFKLGKV